MQPELMPTKEGFQRNTYQKSRGEGGLGDHKGEALLGCQEPGTPLPSPSLFLVLIYSLSLSLLLLFFLLLSLMLGSLWLTLSHYRQHFPAGEEPGCSQQPRSAAPATRSRCTPGRRDRFPRTGRHRQFRCTWGPREPPPHLPRLCSNGRLIWRGNCKADLTLAVLEDVLLT